MRIDDPRGHDGALGVDLLVGRRVLEVREPGDVPADIRFDAIWSNPPIRIGKPALHDLLATWLARLDAGGSASLVVQKHLGADSLLRWLIELGYRCDRVGSKAGFRLLTVRPG